MSDHIRKQAADWLIELETVPDLITIWPAFETWLDQDPEHARVFYPMLEAWWKAGDALRSMSAAELAAWRRPPLPTRAVSWIVATLVFLAALSLAAWRVL